MVLQVKALLPGIGAIVDVTETGSSLKANNPAGEQCLPTGSASHLHQTPELLNTEVCCDWC